MKAMKFTPKGARKFAWEGVKGFAYLEKKDFPRATAAYVETTKSHGKLKNLKSDVIYYVISGNGKFFLKDKWLSISKGDVVIVPKNTVYDFKAEKGVLKLFMVHTPAYEPKNDKSLE